MLLLGCSKHFAFQVEHLEFRHCQSLDQQPVLELQRQQQLPDHQPHFYQREPGEGNREQNQQLMQ